MWFFRREGMLGIYWEIDWDCDWGWGFGSRQGGLSLESLLLKIVLINMKFHYEVHDFGSCRPHARRLHRG